jgi:hypothetical protein
MIVDVMATPANPVGLKADPQGTRAPPPILWVGLTADPQGMRTSRPNLWVGLQPDAFRTPTPSA